MKLHGVLLSGHVHRVQLLLGLLDLPYEFVTVDLANRTPEFLAKSPFGEIPVLEDGDVVLSDSTAILVYLASKYGDGRWLPRDPVGAAQVQRWLSNASGKIAYGPAAARLVTVFGAQLDHERAKAIAVRLFDAMERELADRRFLVNDEPTLADVAAYSYIAHAPEGGVSLRPYPNIRAWLGNVRALPGFVAMPSTAAGLAPETC
ncbi:glutathione S-transferase family protein [uncultured Massilia sp.]|uniref:glutathione S-transferase family protein n=1 Tax=uncultured Massilia sp. TaxID=169973 RepID=UPI0025F82E91|nr:glutathione S-transferase [uncultured Massilia sp.]